MLGGRPEADSLRSGVGWDGNPFEYSFELKSSSNTQTVRFVVDVSPLRPADDANPLGIKNFETVRDALAKSTPGFDDTWYRSLRQWFVHTHRSTAEQKRLVAQVGYQMPMILAFDIRRRLPAPDAIPVMAKMYFPPCFTAAAEGITRWEAVRRGVLQLPNIESQPNILRSLDLIQEYLDTKPKEYENGPRYLATDFVTTEKARLKIYMRPARKILAMQRDAMTPGYSTLLIHDHIAPRALAHPHTTAYELTMMVMVAGTERTEAHWEELLQSEGYKVVKIWRSPLAVQGIIEAELA
ncbi:hypothetical protein Asppvi_007423 [Aspergillus pseudoviridinutans]|uniref:O-methyltransferase n=1 Tax=Aspergillus pseudoviridinutans TaxID=1517512 RepID=A0A9P3BIM1_9EURO|nr:uncharacterized protein Asppvi_007423 [Aspergillus pseudoviridinutans]GIJ88499.1 hypothetical protein Asppvi_007423 [Aspergillus pseudoviridinutans]